MARERGGLGSGDLPVQLTRSHFPAAGHSWVDLYTGTTSQAQHGTSAAVGIDLEKVGIWQHWEILAMGGVAIGVAWENRMCPRTHLNVLQNTLRCIP